MNFKKISTIALAATSMALFSCQGGEYGKVKSWVENNYKTSGKSWTGVGGIEIFDFRETTTEKCKEKVKAFLENEYQTWEEEKILFHEAGYGYVDLEDENPTSGVPYYKELELLNKDNFEKIIGTEEEFKNANGAVVYEEGNSLYFTYDDTEKFFDDAKIRAGEEFDERGVEIADYYFYDISTPDGKIKGSITTYFITELSEN